MQIKTRNTFCGTWYLPHSHVHNEPTVPIIMAECMAHERERGIYFHCRSKIWPRRRVPRFPLRRENFGDSAINKRFIAYFSLRMRETAVFSLLVYNLTSPSCSSTPITFKVREFRRFEYI